MITFIRKPQVKNSKDYAQKPQRYCMLMNSASELSYLTISFIEGSTVRWDVTSSNISDMVWVSPHLTSIFCSSVRIVSVTFSASIGGRQLF
jgi:hypothetical protein